MSDLKSRIWSCLLVPLLILVAPAAYGFGKEGVKVLGGDFSANFQVRLEAAFSTSGKVSPVNQFGDPANGIPIRREAGNPFLGWNVPITPSAFNDLIGQLQLNVLDLPGMNPRGVTDSIAGVSDVHTRYVPSRSNDLNYHALRFEATPKISWGDWSLITRFRALYDPGDAGYRDFDYDDYSDINGGITGGVKKNYHGKVNHLGYHVEGDNSPLLFERSGKNYMIDLPAFFLEWTNGQTTARFENQSVAWGQLLFFRIMDVANGLDLRRHLILDRAIEEYADERMSAPGLRITNQATDQIVADLFVQQFIPTILTNPNTPYNVVAPQFTVRDRYIEGGYDEEVNYGIRLKAELGTWNWQAMYTRRFNPLGAIRWSKSGVNKKLPDSNSLGLAFNRYCELVLGSPLGQGCGPQLAQTAFEASPAGVFSAEEWFFGASYTKLHALDALDSAINDFPVAQQLLAQPVNGNVEAANNQLDAFFMAGEGLRGHIERHYFAEDVIGIGGGYVFQAEPGSFMDQLIINLEATYTIGRKYTEIDLGHDFAERDELQIGIVLDKYHRFSQSFPATYLLFQYLWQKNFDLVGLSLDGYGSKNFSDQGVVFNPDVPTRENPEIAPGLPGGAHYISLAALQPLPAYVWELSVATLIDAQGGLLAQPAVQWKPRGNVTVNLFYNHIESKLWGNNANNSIMSFIDFADEIGLRVGFQF